MNFDDSFRRMRRTFDDFFNDRCYRKPAIDVYNKSDEYVLHADVPGIQKSDVNVELVGDNNLVIEGEFKPYKGFDRNNLLVNERDCGKFRREIFLSCDLQVDKMSAVIENGILEVRLPKAQRTSSTGRKIEIN
ncbi:HSP20-like chaperone [Rhizophagus diaphanus]|nr:HSP20-like chaperone [Rhizophagus diaphanus] [Rhizophagus sp. MUCL 43196]